MPEGPELYKAAEFLNRVARQYVFTKIRYHTNDSTHIPWDKTRFSLSAVARGKEIKITLSEDIKLKKGLVPATLNVLLTFGMAGRFAFTRSNETQKHSLLMFDTDTNDTFSFVDTRHFGRWRISDTWSDTRGPCIISEYPEFRSHVLSSLDKPVFNKPIGEVMLDQRYFSSIGNYLRAEVLHRLDIDPYLAARNVLEHLQASDVVKTEAVENGTKIKTETVESEPKIKTEADILQTCHEICWEAIKLPGSGKPYDPDQIFGDHQVFENWLQCYMQPGMSNSVDGKGRTMWHGSKYGKGKSKRHHVIKPTKTEDEMEIKQKHEHQETGKSKDSKREDKEHGPDLKNSEDVKPRRRSSRIKSQENLVNDNNQRAKPYTKSPYF